VVSRGGRLLLNVGPTTDGEIPAIQESSLRSLGRWMSTMAETIRSAERVDGNIASPSEQPWVRWLRPADGLVALIDEVGRTMLRYDTGAADPGRARLLSGTGRVEAADGGLVVEIESLGDGPAAVRLPWLP
jgi:alpha-L-fucosidase